jgi:hypothetical protein
MNEQPLVPLSLLVDLWRTLASIGVSLADLGRWESEPMLDERFSPEVYREFLVGFDVTRKLLDARRMLDKVIETQVGADEIERLAEDIEYWEWHPQ